MVSNLFWGKTISAFTLQLSEPHHPHPDITFQKISIFNHCSRSARGHASTASVKTPATLSYLRQDVPDSSLLSVSQIDIGIHIHKHELLILRCKDNKQSFLFNGPFQISNITYRLHP